MEWSSGRVGERRSGEGLLGRVKLIGFCLGKSKALTFCGVLRAVVLRVIGCGLAGGDAGAEWGQGAHEGQGDHVWGNL